MSISRRGMLAVGLAVAVVGTLGGVSTMTAGAAETPAPAAEPVAEPVDSTQVPPLTLPWGGTPRPIVTGRDGATSAALAAAGASAANDTSTGPADDSPKGAVLTDGVVQTSQTDVPPRPPGRARAVLAADQKVKYTYAGGQQYVKSQGVAALMKISRPKVATGDWHSLGELAVRSGDDDTSQVVEVGWTVDRTTNGDDDVHLFTYFWIDGKEQCYNLKCKGFVPLAGAGILPGATLATDAVKQFGIQHFNNAWWIAYDSAYIGSYPDSLWKKVPFLSSELISVFGEVAAATFTPCTQMGNGKLPSDTAAARISSVTYPDDDKGPVATSLDYQSIVTPAESSYALQSQSTKTFRFGGPGTC